MEEALAAVDACFKDMFGNVSTKAVIEEFLQGEEAVFSVCTIAINTIEAGVITGFCRHWPAFVIMSDGCLQICGSVFHWSVLSDVEGQGKNHDNTHFTFQRLFSFVIRTFQRTQIRPEISKSAFAAGFFLTYLEIRRYDTESRTFVKDAFQAHREMLSVADFAAWHDIYRSN